MKFFVSAGAAVMIGIAGAAFMARNSGAPTTEPVANGFSLRVDLSERQLYVLSGGETVETYAVAVGAPSFPTPKGSFNIRRIIWNPRWVPPDSEWAKKKIARAPGDPKNPMG